MGEIWSAVYADSNAGWVGTGVTVNVGGGVGLGVNNGVATSGIGSRLGSTGTVGVAPQALTNKTHTINRK